MNPTSKKILGFVAIVLMFFAVRYVVSSLFSSTEKNVRTRQNSHLDSESPYQKVQHAGDAGGTSPIGSAPTRTLEYYPRDPDEWQGMLVRSDLEIVCPESSKCGLALACVNARCVPCRENSQCALGEVCVLDHCLVESLAGCKKSNQCGKDSQCVLTGYSQGDRGNKDMKSVCLSEYGGKEQKEEDIDLSPGIPAGKHPIDAEQIQNALKKHREDNHE